MKRLVLLSVMAIFLTACGTQASEQPSDIGMGMGPQAGMMERHHARIPDEYATLKNPIESNSDSLERGGEIYAQNCASCHGDGGMGDGPAAASLDPAASPVARTSQMMGDGYLFWRISEGGTPFDTAMPAWKETLDEQARWDTINYLRALGAGEVKPASGSGGATYDPQAQATQEAEILAQAVEAGVITQAEADTFTTVHSLVEQYREAHPEVIEQVADATEREALMLSKLVEDGSITQTQADAFVEIHDRLGTAGFMP